MKASWSLIKRLFFGGGNKITFNKEIRFRNCLTITLYGRVSKRLQLSERRRKHKTFAVSTTYVDCILFFLRHKRRACEER